MHFMRNWFHFLTAQRSLWYIYIYIFFSQLSLSSNTIWSISITLIFPKQLVLFLNTPRIMFHLKIISFYILKIQNHKQLKKYLKIFLIFSNHIVCCYSLLHFYYKILYNKFLYISTSAHKVFFFIRIATIRPLTELKKNL